jgi:uncharacterized protein (DUF1778 family)
MATISLRLSEEEYKLLQEYTKTNDLSLSSFVRETVFDYIENDLAMDEERILRARARLDQEKTFDHSEVWKELGI